MSLRSSAIDDDSTFSQALTICSMPHQMQRNGQALFAGSKAVARRTRAAVRPMPHQSPTSAASSVQRTIRTNTAARSSLRPPEVEEITMGRCAEMVDLKSTRGNGPTDFPGVREMPEQPSGVRCLDAASLWLSLPSTASAVNACLAPAPFSNRLAHPDRRPRDGLRSLVRYRETYRGARFP